MYEQIGWQRFMEMAQPTYIPLTLEFFNSFEVKVSNYNDNDSGQITFRLANIEHSMTLQQLNQIFDFPKHGSQFSPHQHKENNF